MVMPRGVAAFIADITKRGTGGVHQELHVNDIRRLIRETGHEPIERDTLYRPIAPRTSALAAV